MRHSSRVVSDLSSIADRWSCYSNFNEQYRSVSKEILQGLLSVTVVTYADVFHSSGIIFANSTNRYRKILSTITGQHF